MLEEMPSHGVIRSEQRENAASGWVGERATPTRSAALPICPCCKQAWHDAPKFLLHRPTTTLATESKLVHLTRAEFDLVELLFKCSPGVVSHDRIIFAMYGAYDREEPENAMHVVKTVVCKIRRKMRGLGWHIKNQFGDGYCLHGGELQPTGQGRSSKSRSAQ